MEISAHGEEEGRVGGWVVVLVYFFCMFMLSPFYLISFISLLFSLSKFLISTVTPPLSLSPSAPFYFFIFFLPLPFLFVCLFSLSDNAMFGGVN